MHKLTVVDLDNNRETPVGGRSPDRQEGGVVAWFGDVGDMVLHLEEQPGVYWLLSPAERLLISDDEPFGNTVRRILHNAKEVKKDRS